MFINSTVHLKSDYQYKQVLILISKSLTPEQVMCRRCDWETGIEESLELGFGIFVLGVCVREREKGGRQNECGWA